MRWIVVIFLLGAVTVMGQHSVTGKVENEKEEAVGFCHVVNRSTGLGKVSDIHGNFKIMARRNDTLEISYVGHQTLTLPVTNDMLVNFVKVTLPIDTIQLPKITIYADRYYKVPLNIKGPAIHIPGVTITNPPDPIKPGDVTLGASGVGGVPVPAATIHGPITYFSKDEREKRAALEAYEETRETITYQKYIAQDSVRKKLSAIYGLDSAEYDQIIVQLHQQYPGIQKTYHPNEIWNWLLAYFERTVPFVKGY
ncbi:carboxypeptidase-like regulatory domain-containing protein [Marinoscillum furvescens]|nr:carboxypeptidase-like regulatory domain-containing protein [Marinoscillum furvescens]